jgi:hypothetical protein
MNVKCIAMLKRCRWGPAWVASGVILVCGTALRPSPAASPDAKGPPAKQQNAPEKTKTPAAKDLFDGKTLSAWKTPPDMAGQGKVYVKDGAIVMEPGHSMTAVVWGGKPPGGNYELMLDGMRLEGSDFFCTTTFPVGRSFCSLVVGGWGGTLVGLSNVDHYDASENQTSSSQDFQDKKWYTVRIRVTDARIDAWIAGKQVVRQDRKDHVFDLRMECEPCRPLGICTWSTKGAVKNIRLRELTTEEAAAAAKEKDQREE